MEPTSKSEVPDQNCWNTWNHLVGSEFRFGIGAYRAGLDGKCEALSALRRRMCASRAKNRRSARKRSDATDGRAVEATGATGRETAGRGKQALGPALPLDLARFWYQLLLPSQTGSAFINGGIDDATDAGCRDNRCGKGSDLGVAAYSRTSRREWLSGRISWAWPRLAAPGAYLPRAPRFLAAVDANYEPSAGLARLAIPPTTYSAA
jgi:hypothetical protein